MRRGAGSAFVFALVATLACSAALGGAAHAALFTRTTSVTGIALDGDAAWVATAGGLERYDLTSGARVRLYTSEDGLVSHDLVGVSLEDGHVVARSREAACALRLGDGSDRDDRALRVERFVCASAPRLEPALPVGERLGDARVTVRATARAGQLVGTATAGVWLVSPGASPRRLTPTDQVCSNHIVSMARLGAKLWLGSFDEGLCAWDGQRFVTPQVPFRRVNDLLATPHGLVIAASEGLFFTRDGVRFAQVPGVRERGFNDLALAGGGLVLATAPGALFEIRVTARGARLRRQTWRPGTSTAVQAVAAGPGGARWLAAEDRGALRMDGTAPRIFDRAAGLPTSWALDVAVLADGTVLLATLRHGLVRLGADGRAAVVRGSAGAWLLHVSVAPDGRTAWIGAQGGLYHYADGALSAVPGELPNDCVHAVFVDGAVLWVATEGGLVRRSV